MPVSPDDHATRASAAAQVAARAARAQSARHRDRLRRRPARERPGVDGALRPPRPARPGPRAGRGAARARPPPPAGRAPTATGACAVEPGREPLLARVRARGREALEQRAAAEQVEVGRVGMRGIRERARPGRPVRSSRRSCARSRSRGRRRAGARARGGGPAARARPRAPRTRGRRHRGRRTWARAGGRRGPWPGRRPATAMRVRDSARSRRSCACELGPPDVQTSGVGGLRVGGHRPSLPFPGDADNCPPRTVAPTTIAAATSTRFLTMYWPSSVGACGKARNVSRGKNSERQHRARHLQEEERQRRAQAARREQAEPDQRLPGGEQRQADRGRQEAERSAGRSSAWPARPPGSSRART